MVVRLNQITSHPWGGIYIIRKSYITWMSNHESQTKTIILDYNHIIYFVIACGYIAEIRYGNDNFRLLLHDYVYNCLALFIGSMSNSGCCFTLTPHYNKFCGLHLVSGRVLSIISLETPLVASCLVGASPYILMPSDFWHWASTSSIWDIDMWRWHSTWSCITNMEVKQWKLNQPQKIFSSFFFPDL